MAWTTPGTATAGEVLTAAFWNTNVRDNSIMGGPVYTNEAARDAAITAPSEGMQCYLTSPTIPAATGGVTAVPSAGVQTIYNGSVWVCVTPVSAYTSNTGTTNATSYSASLSGSPGTNPSVTLVTGTTAMITHSMVGSQTGVGHLAYQSVAISGAGTVAASADWESWMFNATAGLQNANGITQVITGLTAGTNTFTLQYKSSGAAQTASILNRRLLVIGVV